jgi:hypothetical protein
MAKVNYSRNSMITLVVLVFFRLTQTEKRLILEKKVLQNENGETTIRGYVRLLCRKLPERIYQDRSL